jgi:L-lactate dehydrogenase complex protein LldF
MFEAKVEAQGGHVHYARDAAEARSIVLDICRTAEARAVTKSKSMVAEEIGINEDLEANGIERIETDLGEYIIQLRREPPSHLVGPAAHLTKDQISDLFHEHHKTPRIEDPAALVGEARRVLRQKYFQPISHHGRQLPRGRDGHVHHRHQRGQCRAHPGPAQDARRHHLDREARPHPGRRLHPAPPPGALGHGPGVLLLHHADDGAEEAGDLDGPEQLHIVLLDNGRAELLGTRFREMLRCIRCGACMNHCPVYLAAGGHAYGWVYVGPMGSVLTPQFAGIEHTYTLPNASTFCGKCEEVCPVRIPLPKLMRHWREIQFERNLTPPTARYGLRLWGYVARRPALYQAATRLAIGLLGLLGRKAGRFRRLPLAAAGPTRATSRHRPAPPSWRHRKTAHKKAARKDAGARRP